MRRSPARVSVNLSSLVESPHVDCDVIAQALDAACPVARLSCVRALPRRAQARLYDMVAGFRARRLEDLVPPHVPDLQPVTHWGINSLPMARGFAKVMYRQPDGRVAGYNAQAWRWFTGPGYFMVDPLDDASVLIDYTQLPSITPARWPRVRSNRRGLSYFVYRDLKDTLRAVSEHVSIGRAARNDRLMDNYFILVREASGMAQALPTPALRSAVAS